MPSTNDLSTISDARLEATVWAACCYLEDSQRDLARAASRELYERLQKAHELRDELWKQRNEYRESRDHFWDKWLWATRSRKQAA